MKAVTVVLVLVVALIVPDLMQAQVSGGTGVVGFSLGTYGRVRLEVPAAGGLRHLDRLSFLAALSPTNVFDYNEDAENVEPPSLTTGGIADSIGTVLTDNSFSFAEPNVSVRVTVYAWNTDEYVIVKFTTTNTNVSAYTLSLGVFIVPKPSNAYGNETVAYNAGSKVAYFFRTGEEPYVGFKLLSGDPFSFHPLDWDTYSPDPDNDVATDSMRYAMTAMPGFDPEITVGGDGSAVNFNSGPVTLAPGDSVDTYYAVVYATSLPALLAGADSAQARYNGVFTGITPDDDMLPADFSLAQNYPNPFNPSTRIAFTLKNSGFTTLKVYDMLGREVAALVDGVMDAGTHEVTFRGEGLASGSYLYRLSSAGRTITRQMMLVR